uniref:Fumarate reductase/succinate dehydrogenase flavoprotein-like C-terminal domain-containing protein n=1 Tax=Panagrolaimus sp. PS1159 TaxID=55785 RepID=A0AC35GC33_9BILA
MQTNNITKSKYIWSCFIAENAKPGDSVPDLPKDGGEKSIANVDKLRHANGDISTADLRLEMQIKNYAKACSNLYKQQHHLKVSDRGLVWNSDLIETLELQNLLINGSQTIVAAENRKNARGDFPDWINEYD